MKRIISAVAITGCLLVSQFASAETKFAVVDMERALFQSNAARDSFKQVEDQFGDDLAKLKKLEQALTEGQNKLKKDAAVMSDEEQRKLRNQMKENDSEYQFYAGKLQQAEAQWRQQFFRANLPRLQEIMKSLIDAEKVDIVFNGSAVIDVKPELDLTKKLLDKLNQASTAKK